MKELTITAAEWKKYKDKLRRISEKASDQMQAYAEAHHFQMDQAMVDYAYALSTKYGEASAALACDMYDELAAYWHADVPSAVPANTATYGEVAKAMYGSMKQSPDGKLISSVADRLVKQAGADTTIKNAIRDGAYWAWIPTGDTCAFCLTLASRGWQKASKKVLRGDHAEHIHAHCDCTFAIAFKPSDTKKYPFYSPQVYRRIYDNAYGRTPREKINSIRRAKSSAGLSDEEYVKKNINDGIWGTIINAEKQKDHMESTHIAGKSYLYDSEDPQKLLDEYSGKGRIERDRSGKRTNKEVVTVDHVVGIDYNSGKETNVIKIHHSKNRTHIVPTSRK